MKLDITDEEILTTIKTPLITDTRPLTKEEENFIQYYVETLNKRIAYEKAFNNGETVPFSDSKASELMERPEIGRRIAQLMQKNLDADVAKSPNLLLKYIQRYLELDPKDYYDDNGRIIPLSKLDVEKRLLISNIIKIVNGRTGDIVITYQLPDKLKLLDYLSKLVTFVAEVRRLTNDADVAKTEEAEKRRDEIFKNFMDTENDDNMEIEIINDKIKKRKKKGEKKNESKESDIS